MKRLVVLAVAVAACGGGSGAAEAAIAASTFLVAVDADGLEVAGRDRLAGGGDEARLDVLAPDATAEIVSLYPSAPVPEPFEFVRDPLSSGGIGTFLASADRVVAVVFPLIDVTPDGRVLSGSLIALGGDGTVVGTDWGDDSDAAVAALVAWGSNQGMSALQTIELAARGLGGDDSSAAQTAADFLR
ncbi:MAG: hypothetical protein WEA76_02930 [Acidimicrobiia bacterium]